MAELDPYNPEGMCPKCGGDDVSTLYAPSYQCHHPGCTTCSKPERIERSCRRCRYQWNEKPMIGDSDG